MAEHKAAVIVIRQPSGEVSGHAGGAGNGAAGQGLACIWAGNTNSHTISLQRKTLHLGNPYPVIRT